MIVGAAAVELHVHGSQSLKQKRGVIRSIAQRVRNRFQLSVAEVGGQDTWQRSVLGLAAAGSDPVRIRAVLEKAARFIEETHLAEVLNVDVEIVELPVEETSWDPGE
jgi:uncharacterized protein YlxP (DUF503 family)